MKDLEKPAKTTREHLADVEDALKVIPHQYPCEYVDDDGSEPSVYVNYDFSTAVVISWDLDFMGFRLEAMHWDRTHGVDDECQIGLLFDAHLAADVAVRFAKEHERL